MHGNGLAVDPEADGAGKIIADLFIEKCCIGRFQDIEAGSGIFLDRFFQVFGKNAHTYFRGSFLRIMINFNNRYIEGMQQRQNTCDHPLNQYIYHSNRFFDRYKGHD